MLCKDDLSITNGLEIESEEQDTDMADHREQMREETELKIKCKKENLLKGQEILVFRRDKKSKK